MTEVDLLKHFKSDPESKKRKLELEVIKAAIADVPVTIQPAKPPNAFDIIRKRGLGES